jgi:hypothetical protein
MLGTGGGIWQGTGTFASPTTGLKLYRSGNVGVLASYNDGNEQVKIDTDGALYAGAGTVKLDASGLSLNAGTLLSNMIKWYSGGVETGTVYSTRLGIGTSMHVRATGSAGDNIEMDFGTSGGLTALAYYKVGSTERFVFRHEGLERFVFNLNDFYFSAPEIHVTGDLQVNGNINTDGYITASGVTNPRIRMRELTMANTAIAALGETDSVFGFVFVNNVQSGQGGIFHCRGGGKQVNEIFVPNDSTFSTEMGTAGRINIYWREATNRYEIQNLKGSQQTVEMFFFAR